MRPPSTLDDFLFDLRGYLILENAIDQSLLAQLNAQFDEFPRDLEVGAWFNGAQRRDYNRFTGLELHNCIELGGGFESLIDHPSWIELARHYGGDEKSYVPGLFIDECVASIRNSGGHHPVHSGGYQGALRGAYGYSNGVFRCGQVNIIVALTDIGPGDGATMVVPGSHKSNFPHPQGAEFSNDGDKFMNNLEGAIEVHLKKGDALLFVDGIMHGGGARTNPGERRVVIYRYGPLWTRTRFGYEYSDELLARVTPTQRQILEPVQPCLPGDNFIPTETSAVTTNS